MNESESKENKTEGKPRFSQEQYDMLKRCSDKKDMTEWNEWRKQNPDVEVHLEGANLSDMYLENALLSSGPLIHAVTDQPTHMLARVYLDAVTLRRTKLRGASLMGASLTRAHISGAELQGVDLQKARIEHGYVFDSNLDSACLFETQLEGAKLHLVQLRGGKNSMGAHLKGAFLAGCGLKDSVFSNAELGGCCMSDVDLRGANFQGATVDTKTRILRCKISRDTDFRGVDLHSAQIDPATRQLLQGAARQKNWAEWYKKHPRLKWIVTPFWWMSDYGLSTGRIVAAFFALAFTFAIIYYLCGRFAPPGIVDNLFIDRNEVAVAAWLVPLRTLYFSIVTMTTLGFGDMYANAHSIWGHILLSVQVILGYVLLAALVTRFAVLFTAGGPAGRFANEQEEKDKT